MLVDYNTKESGAKLRALFLDFDSTISVAMWLARANKHCVADNTELFLSMSREEVIQNFGGAERLEALRSFLHTVASTGAKMQVVSWGRNPALQSHLEQVGLLDYFDGVYGSDSAELQSCGGEKASWISQVLQENALAGSEALFVDDSISHIESASGVCRTMLVANRETGMSADELSTIIGLFGGHSADMAAASSHV
jgi:FMN phosphatase YigB (HAD superfamily)